MIKIHIGIDPDITLNGIACWDSEQQNFDYIKKMSFWDIIDELDSWNIKIHVVIDAGWLIKKSNFHSHQKQSKYIGEKIAKNVGQNHQVGLLIKEYCDRMNIKCTLVKPGGKVNANTFKGITYWQARTNQEMRDAAMLVYGM